MGPMLPSMVDVPRMSKFRIEIPDSALAEHSRESWSRMVDYLERRFEETAASDITWWGRPEGDVWVYQGNAPSDVIAVLQAAARGDDLAAVLDFVESR